MSEIAEGLGDSDGGKGARSRRRKKELEAEVPTWDASTGAWRSSSKGKGRVAKTALLWLAPLLLVVALVVGFVKSSDRPPESTVPESLGMQDQFDNLVGSPLVVPDEELEIARTLPKVMQKSESAFLATAEPMARAFLEAETAEDILPLVYQPERIRKLLQDRYPDGKIPASGMAKFNANGRVSYKDSFAAVTILTPEYESKQLAFIDGDNGLKIDWESWVGWSEVSWPVLLETKPETPVLVRVMARWVDYYNFGFSDENAWRSYRLVSPDGRHTLYGYVDRNSLLDQRLRPSEPTASIAVTLKIHFRPDEQSDNQVVVDSFISDGWVLGGESD